MTEGLATHTHIQLINRSDVFEHMPLCAAYIGVLVNVQNLMNERTVPMVGIVTFLSFNVSSTKRIDDIDILLADKSKFESNVTGMNPLTVCVGDMLNRHHLHAAF